MDWKTLLAYVTGSVDEQLLLRIEYLVAENGPTELKLRPDLIGDDSITVFAFGTGNMR